MPEPYWSDEGVTLHLGDCLDVLRAMEADSIDAIVTDPPAGIAFMDREWDDFRRARNPADAGRDNVFGRTSARGPEYGRRDRRQFVDMLTERMTEAYRVLKPGGHALVWAIPRTSHWTAWALEDAGFDIRDCVLHLFGSGFPKSRNVSKDIDAMAGAEREVLRIEDSRSDYDGHKRSAAAINSGWRAFEGRTDTRDSSTRLVTAPATEDAARWEGWGTALKPGQEMWWLVRKPLAGTVAASVLEYGTGALNIGGCRVHTAGSEGKPYTVKRLKPGATLEKTGGNWRPEDDTELPWEAGREYSGHTQDGRWPANIVLTHSAACEPIGLREVRSDGHHPASRGTGGLGTSGHAGQDGLAERKGGSEVVEAWDCAPDCPVGELDRQTGVLTSGANPERRRSDKFRDAYGEFAGQETCIPARGADSGGASRFYPTFRYAAKAPASERPGLDDGTAHETVKSLDLMRWLVRLVAPPDGTVLDMFAGSGPTAEACIIEGFRCILIEQAPKSAELIVKRLSKPIQPLMFGMEDSAPAAPVRRVAAPKPKPVPEVPASLFDEAS